MGNKLTKKEIIFFCLFSLLGIVLTILSFIFYYKASFLSPLEIVLIDIVDGIYLFLNVFTLLKYLKVKKIWINTFLIFFNYLLLFLSLGSLIVLDSFFKMTLLQIQDLFQIALFLGPCFIILLPIFGLICTILG